MVMKLSDLYLETRRKLLACEDADRAAFLARELVSFATGKTREQILADRDHYASDKTCEEIEKLTLLCRNPKKESMMVIH